MIKATHRIPGLLMRDHAFQLPLDYSAPDGAKIEVFGREVADVSKKAESLPWLVFFQGGPGGASPRPMGREGWLKKALDKHRVFLLDQRGTGLSTPVNHQTLARFDTPREQAEYLKHFRADNIVRDAEAIRRELAGPDAKWSALGQSYGGFCILRYLSASPEGLDKCYITGGVPSIDRHVDDVYRATHGFCAGKSRRYYERHPGDVAIVREIVRHLLENEVVLPCGERLSVRRFQNLGMALGFQAGPEELHYLFETAFVEGRSGRELSYAFLRAMETRPPFAVSPIFSILHEAIYCQGFASNWSADRLRAEHPEFDDFGREPFLFLGEMIGRWMFDEFKALQPLKEAADILAEYEDWPMLYDRERLSRNEVPVACAVYYEDMFVSQQFSLETINSVPNMRAWVTNEYEHCGLRASGDRVLSRLMEMAGGEA